MLNQRILKYIYTQIISILVLFCTTFVYAQQEITDSTVAKDTVKLKVVKKDNSCGHLSLGIDLFHPFIYRNSTNLEGYEFIFDYYLKHDLFLVVEGGWGGSNVSYNDLIYNTKNNFIRVGVNRSLLLRRDSADWDNLFIGIRLAGTNIQRSEASFIVIDSLWGNSNGVMPGKSFFAVWAELTMGVRVQLFKGLSAGWDIRGKFMINSGSFLDLSPLYIAGYGGGDQNAVFDFDFYLTYGINWKRKFQRKEKNIDKPEIEPIKK